jgi:hypothetical protein
MGGVLISRTQAIQIVSLSVLLREGLLKVHGDRGDVHSALSLIQDIAEECALQLAPLSTTNSTQGEG